MVNVQAILGHITLFAGSFPNELYAGEVICIENGMPHRSSNRGFSSPCSLHWRLGFLDGALRRKGFVASSETTTSPAGRRFSKQRFFPHAGSVNHIATL
jgi:hypothetical protein